MTGRSCSCSRSRARRPTPWVRLREAKRRGHPTLAIVNTVGSTIAREADGGIYLHAGPEVGVASTKAFSAQVMVLTLLALQLGRLRSLPYTDGLAVLDAIERVPESIAAALASEPTAIEAAELLTSARSALFLGRDIHYPVALEGALKLKEISYLHAEGYPTAEMKHGPIALIDPQTPSIFVAPKGPLHAKTLSNIEEVRARRGPIIAVGTAGDEELRGQCNAFLPIPDVPEVVQPLVAVVPSAIAGLPRREAARLRHRQAEEFGEERDGGVRERVSERVQRFSTGRSLGCLDAYFPKIDARQGRGISWRLLRRPSQVIDAIFRGLGTPANSSAQLKLCQRLREADNPRSEMTVIRQPEVTSSQPICQVPIRPICP